MAMTTCKECGKEISTTAKACPSCGANPKNTKSIILKVLIFILIVLIMLVGLGMMLGSSPEAKERQRAKDVISTCWDEQAKKSLSAETAQFVASACEKLESEYEQKYGSKP